MSGKTRDWTIALGYVAMIYLTLEVARLPLAFLRSHGWLRLSLSILATVTSVGILTVAAQRHRLSLGRILMFAGIGMIYYFSARTVKTPEEQLHFFEYGLVGIFFLHAVAHDIRQSIGRYTLAWSLAFVAGWVDEFLQGLLPHRHYDLRDVGLNAISAALGLLIAFILTPTETHR